MKTNLSAALDLLEASELAGYELGHVVDSESKPKLVTCGRWVQISHQALTSEDLSAFIPIHHGFGAVEPVKEGGAA